MVPTLILSKKSSRKLSREQRKRKLARLKRTSQERKRKNQRRRSKDKKNRESLISKKMNHRLTRCLMKKQRAGMRRMKLRMRLKMDLRNKTVIIFIYLAIIHELYKRPNANEKLLMRLEGKNER